MSAIFNAGLLYCWLRSFALAAADTWAHMQKPMAGGNGYGRYINLNSSLAARLRREFLLAWNVTCSALANSLR
jgi:hypothetical protein